MSYSFSVRGSTKAEVAEKVSAELDKVVASQPIHKADHMQAQKAAEVFVGLLADDSEKDISVSVSGSIGWNGTDQKTVTAASVNVSASLTAKT